MSFSGEDVRDRHTRVHTRSSPGFLERLGETMVGMAVGVVLFFLSFYVLFTNEGRAIRTASSLDEGLAQVVTLHPDVYVDPQNNGRLVHLSASLRTAQPLYDPNYKVSVQAVKLKRNVEMYQWVESQESRDYQENGETKTETTYTYSLIDQINNFKTLSLSALYVADPFLTVYEDYFYHTANPRRPEVGDVRVSFSYAGLSAEGTFLGPAQKVSVVAMQNEDKLMPFKTKSKDTLEILYLEELTAEEVFAREHQYNMMMTWTLRAGGWLLMFIGINMTMRIFYTLVDWVPVLRELVSVGVTLFAMCVSCSLALLTISVGWLFYRPLVAALIAAVASLPVLVTYARKAEKKHQ
ncbi:transmembrane protein 43 isoform X2 [Ictalurus punctatus]|uniref:Transmembrane protein 43 isoform X2 n=1 Tax=Ictalurus punctatus TaxID=7998 RepID=A0A9F7QY69_ICTPU|nr:transmembrane protein 43 isoform X2 [Ictalurus punctatus]